MNILKKKFLLTSIAGITFFLLAFLALPSYGISWDEPTHFKRGQGYLWFLLNGDNDYHKLPQYNLNRAQNDPDYHERSIYQDDKHNAAFYRTIDGTHPPLADILAAATNMIFYQKLGWLGDVESYHLFEIFVASLGVTVLFLFVYESFGLLAALFSTLLFVTYPLFWAESHFNIKDPVETSWIILTLYFLWNGVKRSSALFIFMSSIFAGFAFATKFNIIFLPLIILPWFIFLFWVHKKGLIEFIKSKKFLLSLATYPLIMFAIFYISYPFLWDNPIVNIGKVLTYYQKNALDPAFANAVLPNWPLYAARWVVLTAPPLVLLGVVFSLIFLKRNLVKYHGFLLLIYLWFFITIARVSIPGVNVYGGVRQIMEYIPAISILAGVGLAQMVTWVNGYMGKRRRPFNYVIIQILYFALFVAFFSHIFVLVKLHPNENVYFNFLIGGLKGAVDAGVPAAGNSFGSAYWQGVQWMNSNVVDGAKLAILQGSTVNIPKYKLRSDIDLSNDYFSGINRSGEYLIALTFNYEHKENFYAWEYVDKFLEPIYEVKADGVPILKIWKNDLEHTKEDYKLKEIQLKEDISLSIHEDKVEVVTSQEYLLSRVVLSYNLTDACVVSPSSVVETSLDGKEFTREKDPLIFSQTGVRTSSFKPAWADTSSETKFKQDTIIFYLAGRKAKFVRFVLDSEKSCILNNPTVQMSILVSQISNENK